MTRLAIILALIPGAVFAGNFYAGTSPANVPWPGGIVPYAFTNTLTAAQQQTYLDGLREWELAANVKFIPHTTETRWILFTYNTSGFDNVSAGYNPQVVSVANLGRAQVGHEMGHSFGFQHENIRPDATNYITVLTNNIADEPNNIHWFTPDPTTVTNGNYDYESVMHLSGDFASTNAGVLATQQPKPPFFARYQFRMGNLCLSPGDRAALAYLYPPAAQLTNVVTTSADHGSNSLRAAMYYATDHPGTTVRFNLPLSDPGYSNGVFNLHLTGHLPPLAANGLVIDGSTQPGFAGKPLIIVDGSQIIPETFTSNSGLLIYSSSNQVKNISFTGFNWNGLTLLYADATNNTIAGCWIGLDATGTNPAPNAYQGILFGPGAGHNVIGGTNALARNVISGNSQYGLWMSDTNTTGNIILGNYIGTDPGGSRAVANQQGGIGIFTNGTGHVIGGTNAAARNVIAGNGGANIFLSGANVSQVTVVGNYIGLNAAGTAGVWNANAGTDGIHITAAANSNSILNNVISTNNIGLLISDAGTRGNFIQGNLIGTDSTGQTAAANRYEGIALQGGATSNLIGGTAAAARNVISGNYYGLAINDAGTSGNVIQGNLIGTDITGTNEVPGVYEGLALGNGTTANLIGGTVAGAGNVIAGNYFNVVVMNPGTSGNLFQGNLIGVDLTGQTALTNQYIGFSVGSGATDNTVGGTASGAGNVISGHDGYGLVIADGGTSGNLVQGNRIGTDVTGAMAIGNAFAGVALWGGATNNQIGTVGAGNTIAFNGWAGAAVYDAETTNDSIRGNAIFQNNDGGISLNGVANHLQNPPVITNAFGYGISTIVSGTLNSLPNSLFFIDDYRNLGTDPGGHFEGQFYLGSVSVTTDGSGHARFSITNNTGNFAGQYLTATATAANGDTSEFSPGVLATNTPVASAVFGTTFAWRTNGFVFSLTLATNFGYRLQATTNLAGSPPPWVNLTNFTAASSSLTFTDRTATNFPTRFYRVVSP